MNPTKRSQYRPGCRTRSHVAIDRSQLRYGGSVGQAIMLKGSTFEVEDASDMASMDDGPHLQRPEHRGRGFIEGRK